jgi:hypothetical protein
MPSLKPQAWRENETAAGAKTQKTMEPTLEKITWATEAGEGMGRKMDCIIKRMGNSVAAR